MSQGLAGGGGVFVQTPCPTGYKTFLSIPPTPGRCPKRTHTKQLLPPPALGNQPRLVSLWMETSGDQSHLSWYGLCLPSQTLGGEAEGWEFKASLGHVLGIQEILEGRKKREGEKGEGEGVERKCK